MAMPSKLHRTMHAENRRYEKGKSQTDPRGGRDLHVRSKNQYQEPQKQVNEKQSPADFLEVLNEGPSPLPHLPTLRIRHLASILAGFALSPQSRLQGRCRH